MARILAIGSNTLRRVDFFSFFIRQFVAIHDEMHANRITDADA